MLRQALNYLSRSFQASKESYTARQQKKRIRLDVETLELRWLPASYSLASATYSVNENAGKVTLTVNLDVPAPTGASVGFNLDTSYSPTYPATVDVDFTHYSGTVYFTAGSTSQTFDVFITDDDLSESTEAFRMKLENPVGTYLGTPLTIGTISTSVVSITNVTPTTWTLTAQPTRLTDPNQGQWDTFGHVRYSANDGNFTTGVPITFGHDGGDSNDAWTQVAPLPGLVYNPQGADGHPVAEAVLTNASLTPATITWNGSYQLTPGNQNGRVYTILSSGTGTTADATSWTATLTATFADRGNIVRTVSNTTVIPGSGTAIAPGWGIAGVDRLVSTSQGMLWVYGAGGAQLFTGSGPSYTSPANNFGSLVRNAGGDYTYTAQNQVTWRFNSSGQLTTVTDPHSLTRTFTYSSGLLSTVSDPDSRTTTFTYSSGKLSSIVEPGGRTVTVTIDGTSGDLTSLVLPDGRRVTYTYDSNHRLTSEETATGTYSYTYDGTTHLLTGIDAGSSIALSSALGQVMAGSATESSVKAVITDALSHKTTFTMDRGGRILTQANSWGGNNQTWEYNAAGQVTAYADPLGQRTTYTYDASHDLTQIRRPDL